MNRGIFVEAHISDLHFGVMNPSIQYKILSEQFLNKIERLPLDIVSVNGDIFDHKFMSNSDTVMYAMKFIDDLVKICKANRTTLILIHGTAFHDANQLKLFYNYTTDPDIDIRIVESVRFENVKGKRILCIPEMYNMGEAYYRGFLDNSGIYDSVYMHGTFENSIYGKNKEDLGSKREPVFSMDSFKNCYGPVISGHVHVCQCLENHFYYTGSPYRWCYGEEQPKGFLILLHNLDTRRYCIHFEEITSFRYDTINLDDILGKDPKIVIDYIKNLKAKGIDNIRVEFTKENDNLAIIKDFYKSDNKVIIKYDAKARKEKEQAELLKKKYDNYNFILDKNLSPYEILARYVNQNLGYAYITSNDLIELLKE